MSKKLMVPLVAVSHSWVEVEAETLMDASVKVFVDADEHGWDAVCEDIFDHPTVNVNWELLTENSKGNFWSAVDAALPKRVDSRVN